MIYLTGDCHTHFERLFDFCERNFTTRDDILILLGDVGLNFYGGDADEETKAWVSRLPITLLCVHGNHERRPYDVPGYEEMEWHGGAVYVQSEYPSLLFAKDGAIYDFDGEKAVVIGGAYSLAGIGFPNEQPDDRVKARVEAALDRVGWRVDYVLTHTVPLEYEPRWAFLPGVDQSSVDKSTEQWLSTIARRLEFRRWYAGHYHVEWGLGALRILYHNYAELGD